MPLIVGAIARAPVIAEKPTGDQTVSVFMAVMNPAPDSAPYERVGSLTPRDADGAVRWSPAVRMFQEVDNRAGDRTLRVEPLVGSAGDYEWVFRSPERAALVLAALRLETVEHRAEQRTPDSRASLNGQVATSRRSTRGP
jgi:hypothetical protein